MTNATDRILQFLTKGDFASAESLCRKIVESEPENADAWHLLGVSLHQTGKNAEAAEMLRRSISVDPGNAQVHYNLGVVLQAIDGRSNEAVKAYRQALKLEPNFSSARNNLGNVLSERGEFGAALRCQEALLEQENDAFRLTAVGVAHKMIGEVESAMRRFEEALKKDPGNAVAGSHLVFASQYLPGINLEKLATCHAEWNERHGGESMSPFPNSKNANRVIRIGFVSPDLGYHPVGLFLAPLLELLSRDQFFCVCYSNRQFEDDQTKRIQGATDEWRRIFGATDEEVIEQIRKDRIDILIDLAGHTKDNRLPIFAKRAAPIQMTWAGYVGSTGVAAMDYLVSDSFHTPTGCDHHYSEEIVRLEHDYIYYEPPGYAPEPGPVPLETAGHVTFGCLNNPVKINSSTAKVWSEILKRVPNSKLILKYKGFDDPDVIQRVHSLFRKHEIEPDRLDLRGKTTHVVHLEVYNEIDVVLDPFPYSGGLTTCEALWMGVPIVTCPGDTFASRHSLSHMNNAGFTETICQDFSDYVDTAVEIANHPEKLADWRRTIRPTMKNSPLCNPKVHADSFAGALRKAWKKWCDEGDLRFQKIFHDVPPIRTVEIGASPVDGDPPFVHWFDEPGAIELVAFEPNPDELEKLKALGRPNATYLPFAVGNGNSATLNLCRAPGMTSLLEPDTELLGYFHGFEEWAEIIRREPVETRRLDEIEEISGMDYLMMDVQGSELEVLRGGAERLRDTLVVQTEVNFVPFYKNQPLFAEIDQFLREAGFYLHRFTPIISRTFQPVVVANDIFQGLSQQLWADAIYVRKFTEFAQLSEDQLWKIARILHDVYGSIDLAGVALKHLDDRDQGDRQDRYLKAVGAAPNS